MKNKLKDFFFEEEITSNYYSILPKCEILINKQKRKLYGKKKNKVYLNDGDYIQIHLFNPLTNNIGVQLELNGILEENILILKPGQSLLLDRFIDTKKKIKYNTYYINGNNKDAKKAIEKNGKLVIYFWNEKIIYNTISNNYWLSGGTNIDWNINYNNYNSTINIPTTDTTLFNTNGMNISNTSYFNSPKLEETGRIEKGEKSNQKFSSTDIELDSIFHTVKYKLLPYSKLKKKQKNLPIDNNLTIKTTNTNQRIYCSNPLCGYRVRNKNWIFCPICGNELE